MLGNRNQSENANSNTGVRAAFSLSEKAFIALLSATLALTASQLPFNSSTHQEPPAKVLPNQQKQ